MDRGRRRAPPQRFTDDADGGGNADDDHGGTSGVSVKCRVAPEINHVLQTIFQHAGSDVQTGVLDMLDLSQLDWKSNSGIVIEALLHCVGLRRANAPGVRRCGPPRAGPLCVRRWRPPGWSTTPASPRWRAAPRRLRCPSGHPMEFLPARRRDRELMCDECDDKFSFDPSAETPVMRYSCVRCDYDLCAMCGDEQQSNL